jgi:protein translocase SecG subunit
MKELIQILQILVSIFLIVSILLQRPKSYFGPHFKRRGLERMVFFSTIFFAILFFVLAILNWIL